MVFLFYSISSFAQFSFSKNYTSNDGLPSSKIYDMLQDSKGYMWFATENGVSRFDGYEFKNFTTNDGLPANSTLRLYKDYKDRIWFASYQGPLSYFENDTIIQFELNDKLVKLSNEFFVDKMHIDTTGTIWLSFYKGGFFSFSSDGIINSEYFQKNLSRSKELSLHYFTNNDETVTWLQKEKGDFGYSKKLLNKDIHEIIFKIDRKYWAFRTNQRKIQQNDYLFSLGNNLKNIKDGKIVYQKTFENEIIGIFEDRDDNIWISVQFQALMMYPKGKLQNEPLKFLPNQSVSKVLQDAEGNYWIATTENGVYCIPSIKFTNYNKDYFNIEDDIIITLETYKDQLFFSTNNKGIHSILIDEQGVSWNDNFKAEGIITTNINDLLVSSENYLLIPNSEFLVFHLDGSKVKNIFNQFYFAYNILQLADKSIILSHRMGINQYKDYKLEYESKNHSFDKRVFSMYENSDSNLLLGTFDGLYILKNGIYSKYDSLCPVLNSRISEINYCNEKLWVGTFNNGIIIKDGDKYNYINEENGLNSNRIKVIYPENKNNIWVGTNKGLSHIIVPQSARLDYEIINYTIWDGLPSNEINDIIKHDKLIWLGTNSGLVSFNPLNISRSAVAPKLNLEQLLVNEKEINISVDSLIFDNSDNNITFNYKAISFKDPGNITYYHKLKGLEEDWLETRNTSVRYPDLEYGDYKFFVKAKSTNGITSESTVFKFTIQKHYSQTVLFKIIIFICGFGFISVLFLWILNSTKRRENLKQQIIIAEQTALRAQMNPHFIFNALNSIQDFVLRHDDKNANFFLTNFSTLIRKILETSKNNTVSLQEEIETIRIYLDLEKLRFEGKFIYIINIDPSINLEETFIPPMLLQTYIENAIWHGLIPKNAEGLLKIKFQLLNDKRLSVSIEDNGIGREKAAEIRKLRKHHKSMGMKNADDRIHLINKLNKKNTSIQVVDLYDQNKIAQGTRIEIIFDI